VVENGGNGGKDQEPEGTARAGIPRPPGVRRNRWAARGAQEPCGSSAVITSSAALVPL
jgi:hypothetical protein